jgi:hypothetical protein
MQSAKLRNRLLLRPDKSGLRSISRGALRFYIVNFIFYIGIELASSRQIGTPGNESTVKKKSPHNKLWGLTNKEARRAGLLCECRVGHAGSGGLRRRAFAGKSDISLTPRFCRGIGYIFDAALLQGVNHRFRLRRKGCHPTHQITAFAYFVRDKHKTQILTRWAIISTIWLKF